MKNISERILQRTLTKDLILGLTLALSLFLFFAGASFYAYYTHRLSVELEKQSELLSDEMAHVLSHPAWDLDRDVALHIATAYLHNEIVAGIKLVFTPDAPVLHHPPDVPVNDIFLKTRDIIFTDESGLEYNVGWIEIWFTREEIHAMQANLIRMVAITVVFSILIVVLVIRFLMTIQLRRPLLQLLESIRAIAEGNYDSYIKSVPQEDINSIITEINLMAGRIKDHTSQLQEEISERKQAEQDRKLLQAQLLQARKMESMGTLAGGVAHDFNNLLQVMLGSIQLLLKNKPENHPETSRLQSIAKSIDRAGLLVRQLLIFSRKAEAMKQQVDLNQEVLETLILLERTIPKMINVETKLAENLESIYADPVQVEQVLLNMAGNAADAMPQGGRLIIETKNMAIDEDFARTHLGAEPGPYVMLTVSDTGVGMDCNTRERIFDPFFTTKEVGKGTGLGLATVYGIIKAHDAHILCYSEPGQGTTFKLFWPAMPSDAPLQSKPEADQAFSGGTETILVVDDEPAIRELSCEALEMLGYTAYAAESGEQALEFYQQNEGKIDLVIMDLNMPGMGGFKCMEKLLHLNPDLKILIASGYAASGPEQDITAAGAQGFISKPFQLNEITSMVRQILDRKASDTGSQA